MSAYVSARYDAVAAVGVKAVCDAPCRKLHLASGHFARHSSFSLTRLCLEGFLFGDLRGRAMVRAPGGSPSAGPGLPQATQSKAKLSQAKLSKAKQSKAKQSKA